MYENKWSMNTIQGREGLMKRSGNGDTNYEQIYMMERWSF